MNRNDHTQPKQPKMTENDQKGPTDQKHETMENDQKPLKITEKNR